MNRINLPTLFPILFLSVAISQAQARAEWKIAVNEVAASIMFHGVVLIEEGDRVVLNRAFPDAAFPVKKDTRYWIASISKSFTATLIYRLLEKHALRVEDTLAKFFADAPADKRELTIAELLTHTSGLPDKYISEGITDRAEAAKLILNLPLEHEPGKEFAYTNDGYSLLAIIASIAGGDDYGRLIEREIFQPAGMTSSGLWPTCAGSKAVLPLPVKPRTDVVRPNWGYKGPDGICSNTRDLAKFMRALRQAKLLSQDSREAMWTKKVPVNIGFAAAGWFFATTPAGSTAIVARGNDHGHDSIIKCYPLKDLVVIVLSSNQNPDGPFQSRIIVEKLEKKLGL